MYYDSIGLLVSPKCLVAGFVRMKPSWAILFFYRHVVVLVRGGTYNYWGAWHSPCNHWRRLVAVNAGTFVLDDLRTKMPFERAIQLRCWSALSANLTYENSTWSLMVWLSPMWSVEIQCFFPHTKRILIHRNVSKGGSRNHFVDTNLTYVKSA